LAFFHVKTRSCLSNLSFSVFFTSGWIMHYFWILFFQWYGARRMRKVTVNIPAYRADRWYLFYDDILTCASYLRIRGCMLHTVGLAVFRARNAHHTAYALFARQSGLLITTCLTVFSAYNIVVSNTLQYAPNGFLFLHANIGTLDTFLFKGSHKQIHLFYNLSNFVWPANFLIENLCIYSVYNRFAELLCGKLSNFISKLGKQF